MQIIYADYFSNYTIFSVVNSREKVPGNVQIMAVSDGLKMWESTDQYLLGRLSDAEFYEMLSLFRKAASLEKAAWENLSFSRRLWRGWLSYTNLKNPLRLSSAFLTEQRI